MNTWPDADPLGYSAPKSIEGYLKSTIRSENLNRLQNQTFLDLNDIIGEHEASIKIDSKNAMRTNLLIISTRDVKDRQWIADLQGLAAKIAERIYE